MSAFHFKQTGSFSLINSNKVTATLVKLEGELTLSMIVFESTNGFQWCPLINNVDLSVNSTHVLEMSKEGRLKDISRGDFFDA
jgi:hypothetical protein